MLRFLVPALGAFLTLASPVRVAAQCEAPRGAVEHAICDTPALAAADRAMLFAANALARELPADKREAFQLDQQQWLEARAGSCGAGKGAAMRRCLLAETEARSRMLDGGGSNRDRGAPAVQPVFFREGRGGVYAIAVSYPQIVGLATPATTAFNKAAHDIVLGDAGLMHEFRSPGAAAGPTTSVVFYDLHYIGPRLASVIFWLTTGGRRWQQPFTARETLVFDLAQGRSLTPGDILAAPAQAVAKLSAVCREQLQRQGAEEGWRLAANADPAAVIANFRNWAPGPFALDILFDAGSVVPPAAGPDACRLDYAGLLPMLKLKGPLPPH